MNQNILYTLTCADCGVIYEYRLFNEYSQEIYKGKEIPPGKHKIMVSHGLCLNHLIKTYETNNLTDCKAYKDAVKYAQKMGCL